jgi:hypothetical protein
MFDPAPNRKATPSVALTTVNCIARDAVGEDFAIRCLRVHEADRQMIRRSCTHAHATRQQQAHVGHRLQAWRQPPLRYNASAGLPAAGAALAGPDSRVVQVVV